VSDLYTQVFHLTVDDIGGVMTSVLTSSTVDRGFEPSSGQTKDYKLVFAALRSKSKDWLTWNRDNVSE
jgi:hypothetical protein